MLKRLLGIPVDLESRLRNNELAIKIHTKNIKEIDSEKEIIRSIIEDIIKGNDLSEFAGLNYQEFYKKAAKKYGYYCYLEV